ncbi:unnamed protein product [Sphagnum troendelagicum]|uniref:Ubiquitin carboxyl-terminal hydrolase n=1 Tax=Sphagnum troendelagicum TaxID=128251 RepID=A0ABP0TP80_9BRYO
MGSKHKLRWAAEGYKPCQHLLAYRLKHGAESFRVLQKCLRAGGTPGRACIKREEKEVPRCASCGRAHGRLYACLLCATIGCWSPPEAPHARLHAQTAPGHDLAVDVDRAELFCCACSDQVYDPDFDRAVIGAQSAPLLGGTAKSYEKEHPINGKDAADCVKRRRGAEYKPWVPTPGEQLALRQGSTPLKEDESLPSGLRGLNNLGNTCFMNSVLQALLHTPPLRNYFLSDRHNRAICQRRAPHLCLGCDMDTIFSAAFSGERTPYSPAQFLYSWWRHAANLAGYEQQDAHEFFISTVDGIHANSGTTSPRARHSQGGRAGDVDCRCIVHRVFSGLLRSDVTCTVCGFTSTTYDPCVDISLDLEPDIGTEKLFVDPVLNGESGGRSSRAASSAFSASTLLGCLDRFTRPERLGANEKFFCQRCQTRQESIKQMSVRKLPLVLCFHIKRFEHSSTRNTSRKVDRYVQFPFFLDMLPYLSSSIVRSRHGNRLLSVDSEETGLPSMHSPFSSEFELFAVVTHSGKLDSGHYVCFLRLSGRWYKCDDAWVTRVSEDVVRASQGYMLYYVQKTLSYKASDLLPSSTPDILDKNGKHGGYSCVSGLPSMVNGV